MLFIGGAPWVLARVVDGSWRWQGHLLQWIGAWVILNGAGLAGWCVWWFVARGLGTPLPADPPKRLVIAGPYRFVRNPMALGFFVMLAGQALVYESWAVVVYGCAVIAVLHLYVVKIEEPDLLTRFGPAYREYQQRVARWLPRPPR